MKTDPTTDLTAAEHKHLAAVLERATALRREHRAAGDDISPVALLRRVRSAIRCNYDPAVIAHEYGAAIDAALGGPDSRGPLEDHGR